METRALEGFAGVESKGGFDVRVEQGETFQVAVNIDSNLVHLVETRIVGSTLQIGSRPHLETRLPGPHVTVKMPEVATAELSGSGRLAVLSVVAARPVSLRLSGSGNVDFSGTAPEIAVDVSGSGDVNLAGGADRVRLGLSGSGSIDAANLPAKSASVALAGSGNVRATVDGPVDVSLTGSGEVDLYGKVDLQRTSKSGSGNIRVH